MRKKIFFTLLLISGIACTSSYAMTETTKYSCPVGNQYYLYNPKTTVEEECREGLKTILKPSKEIYNACLTNKAEKNKEAAKLYKAGKCKPTYFATDTLGRATCTVQIQIENNKKIIKGFSYGKTEITDAYVVTPRENDQCTQQLAKKLKEKYPDIKSFTTCGFYSSDCYGIPLYKRK